MGICADPDGIQTMFFFATASLCLSVCRCLSVCLSSEVVILASQTFGVPRSSNDVGSSSGSSSRKALGTAMQNREEGTPVKRTPGMWRRRFSVLRDARSFVHLVSRFCVFFFFY